MDSTKLQRKKILDFKESTIQIQQKVWC